MPELPEIETICRYLTTTLTSQIIKKVIIRQPALRWPIPKDLPTILKNCTIKKIYRRAKYLIITCQDSSLNNLVHLIIHLGMSGKLIITDHNTPIKKHDHVDLILNNGYVLRYNDIRRFGSILWTAQDPLTHVLLHKLGPEPFDSCLDPVYLLKKAKNHQTLSIKQFIMHNKIIVGVGNIYANEALFRSKIYPGSLAKNLTLLHMKQLLAAIRKILKQAIKQGGTTLQDFSSPTGELGKFVNSLEVYGKKNQPCIKCNTPIMQLMLGQRSTFYCPNCQVKI